VKGSWVVANASAEQPVAKFQSLPGISFAANVPPGAWLASLPGPGDGARMGSRMAAQDPRPVCKAPECTAPASIEAYPAPRAHSTRAGKLRSPLANDAEASDIGEIGELLELMSGLDDLLPARTAPSGRLPSHALGIGSTSTAALQHWATKEERGSHALGGGSISTAALQYRATKEERGTDRRALATIGNGPLRPGPQRGRRPAAFGR